MDAENNSNNTNDEWKNIPWHMCVMTIAGLIISLAAIFGFSYVLYKSGEFTNEIGLVILLGLSVISLVVTLAFVAFIFDFLKLSTKKSTLGLPEGSIRAVIALSLIFIFMISSVYLYSQVDMPNIHLSTSLTQEQIDKIPIEDIAYIRQAEGSGNETFFDVGRITANTASVDIAKQIITTVSTLVVAVAGFYFGSKTVTEATGAGVVRGGPAVSVPVIRSINPEKYTRGKEFELKIYGKNLELAADVYLIRESTKIQCIDITSNPTVVKCKLKVSNDSKTYPGGTWTVVVVNSDKAEDQLKDAFTVEELPKPEGEVPK